MSVEEKPSMTRAEKKITWNRMVEQAQADFTYYKSLPDENSAFGKRFRDVRLAECETILSVNSLLRKKNLVEDSERD